MRTPALSPKRARIVATAEAAFAEVVDQAACADPDIPSEWFFPDKAAGSTSSIRARRICATCPIVDDCREYALVANISHGIFGNTTPRDRRRIRRERRRAA